MTDVVIAPHFDDGVLSVASVLSRAATKAVLVTVCGGAPTGPGDEEWDQRCGFESGVAAALARADEDRAASALAGNQVVHLPFCDGPYRAEFPTEQVVARLAVTLDQVHRTRPGGIDLWAPAGVGGHPDHLGTRAAALALARTTGARLRLYADCPYAFGPGWSDLSHRVASVLGESRFAEALAPIARQLNQPHPTIVRLDDTTMRLKLAMLRCHASQLAGLAEDSPGFTAWHGPLRQEAFWPVDTSSTG